MGSLLPVLLAGHLCAQSFVITEFNAANANGLRDEDGDCSDWIELYNPGQQAASLAGWYLTDSAKNLDRWQFPSVSVPSGGFVVVFASGKDRRDPKTILHTNFKLSRDGGYLALVQPDGTTIASEFAPAYPRQALDVSYGKILVTKTNQWVPLEAAGRLLVPTNNQLGQTWLQPGFDDSSWTPVALGIGYYRSQDPETPVEPGVPLADVTQPGDPLVPTSSNSPSNEGVVNAIDNSTSTKYLNFDKLNAGFTVTPSAGKTVVVGLRLTSANDAPERDPTSYVLSGSNDGQTFTEIARGSIPDFTARFSPVEVSFTNTAAYSRYKLLFPTVRNAANAVAVQISEVEFLGRASDASVGLTDFIKTSVETLLFGHSCAYLRLPFTVGDPQQVGPLTLRMRYDDGFVAFLNGVEVARANAPQSLACNSLAPTNRYRCVAVGETRFDLSQYASLVRTGANVLAIQGFTARTNSVDFLLEAQLETVRSSVGDNAYFATPTPGSANGAPSLGLVSNAKPSPKRGSYETPFALSLSCATPGASIRYTTNGSAPNGTNGTLYAAPLTIDHTTILRAAAFKDGWVPSKVTTHTYLFLSDVVTQTLASALAAGFPTNWNGVTADYGLDPRVAGPVGKDSYGGKYARTLKPDLQLLPSMSIVMDLADLFGSEGFYSNPTMRGSAWERPISIEMTFPDGTDGFQEDAGIRAQGGAFRGFNLTMKKSFRIVFRKKYGAGTLNYPLFGADAADQFDDFTLRATANDAWPYAAAAALYVRDPFAMDTARAMGMIASHGRFVHLYINGLYWGLYNPVERPDAAFSATYRGGDKADWDAIGQDSVSNGSADAWNRMLALLSRDMSKNENYQYIQGNNPDGTRNAAYEDLVDVPNLVDYVILNFYIGNVDWPGRNWWVGRNRNNGDGFHFYPWDSETALGFSDVNTDCTGASAGVARPYAALRANADFRITFADHVYQHFFNDGALYVNSASPAWNAAQPQNNRPAERFVALANTVSRGIVGESARWGDQMNTGPFTHDEHWQPQLNSLLTNYFPYRSAKVIAQFRAAGLYPKTDPPVMNQRGGLAVRGFGLTLTASRGIIYYTTNGADPRTPITGLPGSALRYSAPVPINDLLTVKARVLNGTEWSALNQATFTVGTPSLEASELNYHPADPTAAETNAGFADPNLFQFIELYNPGPGTFNLDGVRFVTGVHFEFTGSAITNLPAGQYVLVVKNRSAFEFRYGSGLAVAGEYSGQLNNGGERVQVVDAQGAILIDFTYDSKPPWPTAADGAGATLEVANSAGNLNLPINWRASSVMGGSPGKANPTEMPALGVLLLGSGQLALSFDAQAGVTYTVYYADSLGAGTWQVLQRLSAPTMDETLSVTLDAPSSSRFFRVSSP